MLILMLILGTGVAPMVLACRLGQADAALFSNLYSHLLFGRLSTTEWVGCSYCSRW